MGWVVSPTPRQLYTQEWPGTNGIGGWVGLRAGLDGCGKFRPLPTGIRSQDCPVRSWVAIPTEVSRPWVNQRPWIEWHNEQSMINYKQRISSFLLLIKEFASHWYSLKHILINARINVIHLYPSLRDTEQNSKFYTRKFLQLLPITPL